MASKFLLLAALATCVLSSTLTSPVTKRQAPSGVPQYALDYAPIVYLYSEERYLPSDIGAQVANTQPEVNFTAITDAPNPLTLDNLADLDSAGLDVYLTSKIDITTNPAYLYGVKPNADGQTEGAISCAIIVNDHGSGLVDVFYMYFYAFNYGGSYGALGVDFVIGDHVGDWEHNMVRFQDGEPTAVWYSQHSNGEAFTYEVVEKFQNGSRPVAYSANGTHANYATTGTHDHAIPNLNLPIGFVEDFCDAGTVWDPTLSAYYYTYNASLPSASPYISLLTSNGTFGTYDGDTTPVNWLSFVGKWGDDQFPESDPRQSYALGIKAAAKYVGGPTGPEDKQLNRTQVCPDNGEECILRTILGP